MFESIGDLGPAAVLVAAGQCRRVADTAEAELLQIAAHWADLHPVVEPGWADGFSVPGVEEVVALAGEGTPQVAEFAPAELGAVLGITTYAGQLLVGDALELRHRLPLLWARIMEGDLQAWRGRKVAEHTRNLSPRAVAWVDTQIAPFAHKLSHGRVLKLIEAALLRFHPEQAAERAREAAETRGVWVTDEMTDGTRQIRIHADALDAGAFDATINHLANNLNALGDTDTHDVRRAKAVGVIANPQQALDLLTPHSINNDQANNSTSDSTSGAEASGADREPSCTPGGTGRGTGRLRGSGKPNLNVYVHLSAATVRSQCTCGEDPASVGSTVSGGGGGGSGSGGSNGGSTGGSTGLVMDPVARVEGLGPVVADLIKDWIGRSGVTIRPVLDLTDRTTVDAYETPTRIRETVILRNPCCPFPWCNNLTRKKDMDHIKPYLHPDDGGPPAQTNPDNLAGLCRRHHRLKTHSRWRYVMAEPGIYLWTSPHGQKYLIDHTGTTALTHAR